MPLQTSRPLLPAEDLARADHQALRSRLLNGLWANDLEEALAKHIRRERRVAWGIGEMSRNPFRSLANQIGGALYLSPPLPVGPNPAGTELLRGIDEAGYWQLMQRVSTDLVGIREQWVRVDWTERGGLLHRPVAGELLHIEAVAEAPDAPALVEEIQERVSPFSGKPEWCWEILDIRDLSKPVHQIVSADRSEDWTAKILGGPRSGSAYPYVTAGGRPYMPGVLYHAEKTGRIWDAYYGIEAVLGSLTVGVLLTFWVHGVKDGSFATVLLAGGRIVGVDIENPDGERTAVISAEPGSIIEVAPISDNTQQISVVQLQPGCDPEKLMRAIGMFEGGLAEYAGVSNADLVRTGADPRSGASLAISREGLRTAQGRYEPQLRRGDLELIATDARVLNNAVGTQYPESGYSLSYPSLPLSAAEITATREDILAKVEAGLESKVDGYMRLHPGIEREQAKVQLRRIAMENAEFSGTRI